MSFRKIFLRLLCFCALLYVVVCTWVYFNQEELLFKPEKLPKTHHYSFTKPYEEFTIAVPGGKKLSAVLFKAPTPSDQLIFFLHGNAGNMEDQDGVALFYNKLGYDFFTYDYRGFGKSSGEIRSERQFLNDAQLAYDEARKHYKEEEIIIVGYSVGTGPAGWLTIHNHPQKLALMAPYYSMSDLSAHYYHILPNFIVKYKFETFRYLPKVKVPVCVFHGKNDETIPFSSSKRLAGLLKKEDRFVPLEHQGHGGFEKHDVFKEEMERFLK